MTTVLICLSGSERDSESDTGKDRNRERACESLGGKLDTIGREKEEESYFCVLMSVLMIVLMTDRCLTHIRDAAHSECSGCSVCFIFFHSVGVCCQCVLPPETNRAPAERGSRAEALLSKSTNSLSCFLIHSRIYFPQVNGLIRWAHGR